MRGSAVDPATYVVSSLVALAGATLAFTLYALIAASSRGSSGVGTADFVKHLSDHGQRDIDSAAQCLATILVKPLVQEVAKKRESHGRQDVRRTRREAALDERRGEDRLPAGLLGQLAPGQGHITVDDALTLPQFVAITLQVIGQPPENLTHQFVGRDRLVTSGDRRGQHRQQVVVAGEQDLFLVREVAEEGSGTDPGPRRDVVHCGRAVPLKREQVECRLDKSLPSRLRRPLHARTIRCVRC